MSPAYRSMQHAGVLEGHSFSSVIGLYLLLRGLLFSFGLGLLNAQLCSPTRCELCLPFGGEQLVHSRFLKLYHSEQLVDASNDTTRTVRVN